MDFRRIFFGLVGFCGLAMALSACQSAAPTLPAPVVVPVQANQGPDHLAFSAPVAWGGEARCQAQGCQLVLVEHEAGQMVLHQFKGRRALELDRQPLAYHPDSAAWLTDDWAVAAVEADVALEFFSVEGGRLQRRHQIKVDFAPRDVLVLSREKDRFTLMATPYGGANVAIVDWTLGAPDGAVTQVSWCSSPWHPALVSRAPRGAGKGVVVGCLHDKRVMYASSDNWAAPPKELARFGAMTRQVRPSPSGKWLYVALETGRKTARIDMDTGAVQYLASPLSGAVSVAPLADDLVIWGEATSLYVQRYDADGNVLETRWLRASGFPTSLQLVDLDQDGEQDLLILNSAGELADVYYGPLWDRALEKL